MPQRIALPFGALIRTRYMPPRGEALQSVWISSRDHAASLEKRGPLALKDCQEKTDHPE